MKKFKFNFKLTAFVVGLFISFLLIFLGGKFDICRSFGLICLGASMIGYIYIYDDSVKKTLKKLDRRVDKLENNSQPNFREDDCEEQVEEDDEFSVEDLTKEEKEYVLMELHAKRNKITKSKKKVKVLFILSGALLIIAGFMLFV